MSTVFHSVFWCRLVVTLGVVPASRVAVGTSSLLIAFGLLLTFKAAAPKLIISEEVNSYNLRFSGYVS